MKKFLNFVILMRFNTEKRKGKFETEQTKISRSFPSAAATNLAKRFFGMIKTCRLVLIDVN